MKVKINLYPYIFFALITVPLLVLLFHIPTKPLNTENRPLAKFPKFEMNNYQKKPPAIPIHAFYISLFQYKEGFNAFFNDNFPFRFYLFKSLSFIEQKLFRTNPLPDLVISGQDDWLFLGDKRSDAIRESKGILQFSPSELKQIERSLLNKKRWLAQRDIDFYIAIAPNKHSVYGEFLPIQKNRPSKLEGLLHHFEKTKIPIFDLAKSFPDDGSILFRKFNSHWNDIGAYWGYYELIRQLQMHNDLIENPSPMTDFNMEMLPSTENDLAKLLSEVRSETIPFLSRKEKTAAHLVEPEIQLPRNHRDNQYALRFRGGKSPLKVLFFRDSFSNAMIKYIVEHFDETLFIWTPQFDRELIEVEKPDIVIYEVVERNIDFLKRP